MSYSLITVIIPLYNHAQYIEKCLDSAASDPYPAKEVVIIDDGSSDDSAALVKQWQSSGRGKGLKNFRFIQRENRGLTRTLNELTSLASGEFVALLASDDYLLPGGLSARVEYLQQHPDKMAVFGDCVVVDVADNVLHQSGLSQLFKARLDYLRSPALLNYELVFRWCAPGPIFMARTELYRLVGGYDETITVEDRDFYFRLAGQGMLGFIDKPVAAYRIIFKNFNSALPQIIKYCEAMIKTVDNNLGYFTGLRRLFLLADKLGCQGKISSLKREGFIQGALRHRTGRWLRSLLKRVYDVWAFAVFRFRG